MPRDANGDELVFGPFRLFSSRQLLLEGDREVRIGSRALAILSALANRRGELVGKDELIKEVWPDTFVDEANLRVHIAALRRALGDGQGGRRYLVNVPGRGYRFVAGVTEASALAPPAAPPSPSSRHNLPTPLARMIGRDAAVAAAVAALGQHRLVSLVGPGGIGKTTVALAVADAIATNANDEVRFVDLGALGDPLLVSSSIGSALGVAVNSADPLPGLVSRLREQPTLIVLDSCEPVIGGAARIVELLLRGVPEVRILATSREPLRAEGEYVQRLAPLTFPDRTDVGAAEALRHSAVQLFVERVAATIEGYDLSDAEAPLVAEICRRLDGIALAIEVAAGRVDAFGVPRLATLLNERFRLLMHGRRTALPRHQTLMATLDWSYETLGEDERTTLRRLGIFAGAFDLDAASAVIDEEQRGRGAIIESIADLVAKSLITADVSAASMRYRLGETTRAYALAKLAEHDEAVRIAARHAAFHRDAILAVEGVWRGAVPDDVLDLCRSRLDDFRAALDWAFAPGGDIGLGADLTAAAAPLWMHLSLVDECQRQVWRALAALGGGQVDRRGMKLQVALGQSRMFTSGAQAETLSALRHGYDIARTLGDGEYTMRALWGLWVGRLNNGAIPDSLVLAEEFASIAAVAGDPLDRAVGQRMAGFSLHFLGRPAEAREQLEQMLNYDPAAQRLSYAVRFQFDLWATGRATLAETLFLLGLPRQALRAARLAVEEASRINHAMTLCNTLAKSSAVALLVGDLKVAREMIDRLVATATAHGLSFWRGEGGCLRGVLQLKVGELAGGLSTLRRELRSFPGNTHTVRYIAYLGKLAEALGGNGEADAAQAAIDEALERCRRNGEHWWLAELLRIKGEIEHRDGASEAAVEALFAEAQEVARTQGALAWELRIATSLARLRQEQGRSAEGREVLAGVLGRFSEGLDSLDCRTAQDLLQEL
jgi:predicted ATPase/DNA-binding winged helix-turn-helix (wHTH) protein